MLKLSVERGSGLAEIALSYESEMLCLPKEEIWKEMSLRLEIMEEASRAGIEDNPDGMKLLRPSAGKIFRAERDGRLPVGGLYARAMASAAVVELTGGSPRQALDAAGVFLQNSMGSICDPVQGFVEIPCHTRNGASSSAFVYADMVAGGYSNSIPFDETVDAMYSVGKMLPRELRCTALGGLYLCPTPCSLSHLN